MVAHAMPAAKLTTGQRAAAELKAAKVRATHAGQTLSWDEIASIIDRCIAADKRLPKNSREELDALFNALAEACGHNPYTVTRAMGARISTALKDIRTACPSVTPEEITRRAQVYRRRKPTWELTPTSLATHWSADWMGGGNETAAAKENLYQEPSGDWRAAFCAVSGMTSFPDHVWKSWKDVPVDWRQQIKRHLKQP